MSDEQVKRYSIPASNIYEGVRAGGMTVIVAAEHDRFVSALRAENEALRARQFTREPTT